jgi:hypothetical protein
VRHTGEKSTSDKATAQNNQLEKSKTFFPLLV